MFGILFGWILIKKPFIDSDSKTAIIVFIIGGWIATFTMPNVSILGHAAGFAAGILLSIGLMAKAIQ
ncbi:rhomboid family intramembrane serine protease [Metabacillus sp. RGM 3146]|uniref:rhomboid family intramembrane serine protease n=1 Tax=Metabacillus sp. RGM 3146 TaxID=3401092 RepID=UPI003B9B6BCA